MNTKKIALITGGTSGIGLATAIEFAKNNIIPIICGRNEAVGKASLETLNKISEEAAYYRVDVSSPTSIEALFKSVYKQFGTIDILVNNAGTAGNSQKSIIEQSENDWDNMMQINGRGTFLCIRQALPIMLKQKSGVVINVSSIAGIKAGRAGALYTASKHAVVGLTKSLGKTYAANNIRFNCVCPGFIKTPMLKGALNMNDDSFPMHRLGTPEEVAALIAFLCDDKASYITGSAITVDGAISA